MGTKDLGKFAEELTEFGPAMKKYSISIKGITGEEVVASASAAEALAELANNLPNHGGIASWFSGSNTISDFGKMVADFGKYFAKYSDSIANVKIDAVKAVSESLVLLLQVAQDVTKADVKGLKTFGEDLAKMGNIGIDAFIEAFTDAKQRVEAAISKLIEYATNEITNLSSKFETAGKNVMEGFINGIKSKENELKKLAKSIGEDSTLKTLKDALGVRSPSPLFADLGMYSMLGLENGFSGEMPKLSSNLRNMAGNIRESLTPKDMPAVGIDTMKELSDGLGTGAPKVLDTGKVLGDDYAKTFSDTVDAETIGEEVATSTAKGINSNATKPVAAAKSMANDAFGTLKQAIIDYREDSDHFIAKEIEMWEELADKYDKNSKERLEVDKELKALREKLLKEEAELRKADFDEQKKLIEHKRKLGQTALFEELDEWLVVQERYAEGTDERLRAEQEMINAIVEHRKLSEMSLTEEYDLWSFMQTRYLEGTDERMRVELELHDVKKRIHEEQKRLNEEIDKIEENYAKSIDDRAKQIVSSWGIFAEVKEKEKVAGKDLMRNLKDQVAELQNWANNVETLSRKAIDEGLLEELRKMGPSANAEISALVKMSDSELTQYSDLWKQKNEIARTAAISELSGLRSEADAEIAKLRDELEKLTIADVSNFTKSGEDASKAVIGGFESNFNDFTQAGKKGTEAMEDGLKSNEAVYGQTGNKYGTDFANSMSNTQTAAKTSGKVVTNSAEQGIKHNDVVYGQTGTKYGTDFSNNLSNTQTAANTSGKTVTNSAEQGIKHNDAVYGQTGTKYGTDFSSNLSNTQTVANASGRTVTNSAEQGIKSNAPVYAQTGAKFGEDFSRGLSDQRNTAHAAGKTLSEGANDGFKSVLSAFNTTGKAASQGFIDGMNALRNNIIATARELALAANQAFQATLRIRSPSVVFYNNAVNMALGLINGLEDMTKNVEQSTSNMGKAAIDGFKDALDDIASLTDDDMNSDFTITPVLDLTNVQNGIESLRKMISGTEVESTAAFNVRRISSNMGEHNNMNEAPGRITRGETKFEFTQNNFSPKALTRLEIYRQTRNQFAQLKGLVEA
jgi:hypothetical protein